MNTFRRFVTSLVCVSLVAAPVQQTVAQPRTANLACVSYAELPAGYGIAAKFNADTEWITVNHSIRTAAISSPTDSTVSVRIWKKFPVSKAELVAENILTYTVPLAATTTPDSCKSVLNNYEVKQGPNGYYLATQTVENRQTTQNTEATAKTKSNGVGEALVAAVVVGGIICLLGGCSSRSSGSSSATGRCGLPQDQCDQIEQINRNKREAAEYDRNIQRQQ